MAISETELTHIHADNLVALKNFYAAPIAVLHPQLRHLVSVTHNHQIFYVNRHDIYVLDLTSNQRTLLSTIPFEARCLAAAHGWVGVGGDKNGDCVFIKLNSTRSPLKCFDHDLDIQVLGGEIVNSMNIHLLQDTPDADGHPVVLISNNDRSVKIYSLLQRQVLTTLLHDKPVNYASLSPDSLILAVVGDSDRVHFYRRSRKQSTHHEYDWLLMAVPTIPTGPPIFDDHGFAVSFSPSGHLCAASSQGGAISVFDMCLLTDPAHDPQDAIISTFRSSRSTLWGCVRSMAFSPPPWDLLAWAEDHGRIGIADLRQFFVRRQISHLDKRAANPVQVQDSTPPAYRDLSIKDKIEEQHLARLRSLRDADPGPATPNSRPPNTRSDHDQSMRRRQDLISYHRGLDLDARERSVLEALETSMDTVEHRTQPFSVNYTSSPRVRPSQSAEFAASQTDYDVQLLNPGARHGPRIHQPRRRTSVVLSESSSSRHLAPPESSRTRISESPGRIADDDLPPMSTNDLTPTRAGSNSQPLPYNIPASDPWDVIQTALESARQTDNARASSEDRPVTLAQIEAAFDAERALGNQLARQLADERLLSRQLRRQLEAQEQLLQSPRPELEAEPAHNNSLEPLIERVLQRELRSEQQFGEQRSQDLETEVRLASTRARRLYHERTRLLQAAATAQAASDSQSSSATTSTLPTTSATFQPSSSDIPASSAALLSDEASRRQRLAHIENLERQVRFAEIRVQNAAFDIQALEAAIQRNNAPDNRTQQSEPRTQIARLADPNSRPPNISSSNSGQVRRELSATRHEIRRRQREALFQDLSQGSPVTTTTTTTTTASSSTRTGSELLGRATESEMRLAQLMFMQSIGRSTQATDSNGNWLAGGQIQRLYQEARAGDGGRTVDEQAQAPTASVEEVLLERGLGTAGIGWSSDGRRLFCGTEEGIFEFNVNMTDRLQFPGVEMR